LENFARHFIIYVKRNDLQNFAVRCIIGTEEGVTEMKAEIHPKYYQSTVRCNCGNEFTTGSTKEAIRIEVCSKCHPFYTGSQKMLIEAGGRVERFKKKYNM